MTGSHETVLKKRKLAVAVVPVPPQLMKIVQEVAGSCSSDLMHVSGNVTSAVEVIESKALRALDSYLNCVCIRMQN
jgi:hypothetical protein